MHTRFNRTQPLMEAVQRTTANEEYPMKIKEAKAQGIDVSHNGSNENEDNGLPYPTQYVYASVPCPTCGAYWYEGCRPEDRPLGPGGTLCDARIEAMERFQELSREQQELERKRLLHAHHERKKQADNPQLTLF